MSWITLNLDELAAETQATLRQLATAIGYHFTHLRPQPGPTKAAVAEQLSQALQSFPEWPALWKQAKRSTDHQHVVLQSQHHVLLSLPWETARPAAGQKPIAEQESLHLYQALPELYEAVASYSPSPGPLKILIMISSPQDSELGHRLNYEAEEENLLKALDPLWEQGKVEVDFCEDGSLEALRDKINTPGHDYHLVYYSGHGSYNAVERQGTLWLEDPDTLRGVAVSGEDFAQVLKGRAGYVPPLVVLSACQSGQGQVPDPEKAESLSGVAFELLDWGLPSVVAMSHSVRDDCATAFAAGLLGDLQRQRTLKGAFAAGVRAMEAFELEFNQRHHLAAEPWQWALPQLYLSQPVERLIDDTQPVAYIPRAKRRQFEVQGKLVSKREASFRFIGRRPDRAAVMPALLQKKPVLLRGQGGLGKSTLAEHLASRLSLKLDQLLVFYLSAKSEAQPPDLWQLVAYFQQKAKENIWPLPEEAKAWAKEGVVYTVLQYLRWFQEVHYHSVLLIFDNLESYQDQTNKSNYFRAEHSALRDLLHYFADTGERAYLPYVLLTGRYPWAGQSENILEHPLRSVPKTDFWIKCLQLELDQTFRAWQQAQTTRLQGQAIPIRTFRALVERLHATFGGHYRSLERFAAALKEAEGSGTLWEQLEDWGTAIAQIAGEEELRNELRKDLAFDDLWALLPPTERQVLQFLAQIPLPVLALALRMQQPAWDEATLARALRKLDRLTLIEPGQDRDNGLWYYQVTPLVREMVAKDKNLTLDALALGRYCHYHGQALGFRVAEAQLGFELLLAHEQFTQLFELAIPLLNWEEKTYQYGQGAARAKRLPQSTEEQPWSIDLVSVVAALYYDHGIHEAGLVLQKELLEYFKAIGDQKQLAITLNNIGQINNLMGNKDTALHYLEESLQLKKQSRDQSGIATTLNNISAIYQSRDELDIALFYLEKSFQISVDNGDWQNATASLNNISTIYYSYGKFELAFQYWEQTLATQHAIGDQKGEAGTLNNICQYIVKHHESDQAIPYLYESLRIYQKIGDSLGEAVSLYNLSRIRYQQEDYQTYYEELTQAFLIAFQASFTEGIVKFGFDLGGFCAGQPQPELKAQGMEILQAAYLAGARVNYPGTERLAELIQHFGGTLPNLEETT